MEWLPIETHDGGPDNVLVCTRSGFVGEANFHDPDGWWWAHTLGEYWAEALHGDNEPTHWMPLPPPPTQRSEIVNRPVESVVDYEAWRKGYMPTANDIAKELRIRDAAFEADDISWAAKMLPNASSPHVVEMAFHKARMQVLSVSDAKRRESMTWLADRGLTDLMGAPVRHDDPLPQ